MTQRKPRATQRKPSTGAQRTHRVRAHTRAGTPVKAHQRRSRGLTLVSWERTKRHFKAGWKRRKKDKAVAAIVLTTAAAELITLTVFRGTAAVAVGAAVVLLGIAGALATTSGGKGVPGMTASQSSYYRAADDPGQRTSAHRSEEHDEQGGQTEFCERHGTGYSPTCTRCRVLAGAPENDPFQFFPGSGRHS